MLLVPYLSSSDEVSDPEEVVHLMETQMSSSYGSEEERIPTSEADTVSVSTSNEGGRGVPCKR
jgi:hypothetical protein